MKKMFIIILTICTLVAGIRIAMAKVVTQGSVSVLTSVEVDHYASLQMEASELLQAVAGSSEYEAVQVIGWIVFGVGVVLCLAIVLAGT